ncbi:hypothetical protein [Dyella acidisoli]|uniref:Uncharacterized protein n=1 Tax=Dyella acidisoli TaxID=1867834 RepID=A0ABQ5XVD4_9GAMM|nr:hypothetical protein [Dyella acidisoli]GLQ95019.1 hypothetical protein GCM10007901_39720 [Dyella acidisoli]
MHFAKAKASSFPYFVALAVILVNLIIDASSIYRVQHLPSVMAGGASAANMMYVMLGSQWVTMVFSAAVGLGYAQWLMDRRRADLPWYAVVGVAVAYVVLSVALSYGWLSVQRMATARMGLVGVQVMTIVSLFVYRINTLIAVMLPLWLAYRVVRGRMVSPGEMRWRSLLIFALLVWAWHLMIVQLALPSALAAASVYGLDLWSMAPWMYLGSFALVLPIWFAALLAWPGSMSSAYVSRALLASFLTTIVNIVSMLSVAFVVAAVVFRRAAGDSAMATGAALVAALLWFVITLPLCWLSVKALMRDATGRASVEQGYRLGEGSA